MAHGALTKHRAAFDPRARLLVWTTKPQNLSRARGLREPDLEVTATYLP